jgi:hypothetical protein
MTFVYKKVVQSSSLEGLIVSIAVAIAMTVLTDTNAGCQERIGREAFDLAQKTIPEWGKALTKLEEETYEKIENDVLPNNRIRARRIVRAIRDRGTLRLPKDDLEWVFEKADEVSGYLLLSLKQETAFLDPEMDVTAEYQRLILSIKFEDYWADALIAMELVGLSQYEAVRLALSSRSDRRSLLSAARKFTVSKSSYSTSRQEYYLEKFPALKDRILDYAEGSHSRTRKDSVIQNEVYRKNRIAADRAMNQRKAEKAQQARVQFNKDSREWADKTGDFKLKAVYKGYEKGDVTFEKADGSMVEVPISRLSSGDQSHIRKILKDEREATSNRSRRK